MLGFGVDALSTTGRIAKVRSARNYLHWERKWLVWNHCSWAKADRIEKRRERHAARQAVREGRFE